MTRLSFSLPIFAAVLLLANTGVANAGVHVDAARSVAISIDHGLFRIQLNRNVVVLLDSKAERIRVTHSGVRAYTEANLSQICDAAALVMEEIKTRRRVAVDFNGWFVPYNGAEVLTVGFETSVERDVSVERVWPDGYVAGSPAERYEVYLNGSLHAEVWLNTDPKTKAALDTINWKFIRALNRCSTGLAMLETGRLRTDLVEASPGYQELWRRGVIVKREIPLSKDGVNAKR
ncbi:MAG: hypothetical protein AAF658_10250, partial [Myxococcota bacterium]